MGAKLEGSPGLDRRKCTDQRIRTTRRAYGVSTKKRGGGDDSPKGVSALHRQNIRVILGKVNPPKEGTSFAGKAGGGLTNVRYDGGKTKAAKNPTTFTFKEEKVTRLASCLRSWL